MEEEELRNRLEKTLMFVGNPNRLETDRPDLFNLWDDYIGRVGSSGDEDYSAKYNRWILHYFILHGKS